MNLRELFIRMQKKMSPAQIVIFSFFGVIAIGSILLMLPVSHQPEIEVSVIDAAFTATSAVCVTGLVTLVTATTWSFFGKIVILCLIQIGGLSLGTVFTYFLIHIGKKVGLKDRLTIQAGFNIDDMGGMVRMVIMVIRGTFIIEGIAAVLLAIFFISNNFIWYDALFYGIFHAVSAFCNAGFDIIGNVSLERYVGSPFINIVIMSLIILGGIGFSVWRDIVGKIRYKLRPAVKKKFPLSLHSKFAIITTVVLILLGTFYFWMSESNNPETLGKLNTGDKIMAALFQSVTLRTAGFASIPQAGLSEASKLVSSILMLVGGSPGGTAGGIKTVTIAILFCSVSSTLKGYQRITAFKRSIPETILRKALSIVIIMLSLWIGGTLLLSLAEQSSIFPYTSVDLLFEVASALGTVGLTTGITPYLSIMGKVIIMLCMFVGRIGPLAIILSLLKRTNQMNEKILYPYENVMIG